MRSRASIWLPLFATVATLVDCSSSKGPTPPPAPTPLPGEVCDTTSTAPLRVAFDPPRVVVAPGMSRPVRVLVNPDICTPITGSFAVDDATIVKPPTDAPFDLRHATYDFEVRANAAGTAHLTMTLQRAQDAAPVTASLEVEVRDGAVPTCSAQDPPGPGVDLGASQTTATGAGSLATAQVFVPPGAFTRTDELSLPPFRASVQCAASDLTAAAPGGLTKLGPPVSFVPLTVLSPAQRLRREIEFAIPINPAAMPGPSRLRHIDVVFQNARTQKGGPRVIPVANPRIEKVDASNSYVLKFSSPWLGTYQAAIAPDAGTRHRTRHLTHRAVLGFSMGAGGAASFGLRHHDKVDAIAALGGASDWNWLLWFIDTYLLAGFCPASNPTCTKYSPSGYPMDEPFAHTEDYQHWFSQGGQGTGGSFSRNTYGQLLWDLSAEMGNPNGQNADPAMSFFPAGPKATDPWVTGDTTGLPAGSSCMLPVEPIKNDPGQTQQQQIQRQCYDTRCDPKRTWVAQTGYFDATYNPDGSLPVISFCDGNQSGGVDPYLDQWAPPGPGAQIPVSAALAVDLNKNGVRDANEPIIRAGHEPWDDTGTDGLFDAQEPGYDAITNPDPNGDDYDYQVNPNGTENDHRYEAGEPYKDLGLDGVLGTKQQVDGGYDLGEGDGAYTQTKGLGNFQAQDPHWLVHQWSTDVPGGPLDDDALLRLDVILDGGVRDLFNFGVVGNHLAGALHSRKRGDGTPLKRVAFYNDFDHLPGETIGQPQNFQPANVVWADMGNVPHIRYGNVDATPQQIADGDGKHVGTGVQILSRIEAGFYYVANAWSDADRTVSDQTLSNPETATINELGTSCELTGRCEKIFTGPKTQRTGPIAVTLPPGYALEENRIRNLRYPVLYVLHGYGQDPRDLEALAIITNNFMNDQLRSYATRIPKFIVVYVDGRCRVQNGVPECVQGTFYMNSVRPGGPQLDTWFTEVLDYIDQNYRTLGPSDVDVVE